MHLEDEVKKIVKGVFYATLPLALLGEITVHVTGVLWDGFWEVIDIIRNGEGG